MLTDPEQTTGTQSQDDGDALETETAGTPENDGRDAGGEPDYKSIHIANKATIEELRRQLQERQSGPQPAAENGDEREAIAAEEQRLAELRRDALNDPHAARILALEEKLLQTRRDTMNALTLQELPKEQRGKAYNLFTRHPDKFPDVASAAQYLEAKDTKEENARLKKELDELKKPKPVREEARRDDVVRTGSRDVPASTIKAQTMTRTQFEDEQAKLRDEDRHDEARARQRDLREGRLVLKR